MLEKTPLKKYYDKKNLVVYLQLASFVNKEFYLGRMEYSIKKDTLSSKVTINTIFEGVYTKSINIKLDL